MSSEWMMANDVAEMRGKSGLENDDWVATGDGEEPWWLPWQKLATVLPGKMSVSEALEYSKLAGWGLEKVPMFVKTETGYGDEYIKVPEHFAIQRTGTDGKVFGVVKGRYRIVSNEQAFDWAQYLLGAREQVTIKGLDEDQTSTYFTSAGSLRGGRVVFLVARTPFVVDLPGGDRLETYLLITNRHDGQGVIQCAIVTIRVVCRNTLERSLAGALANVKIRHTASAEQKLGEAQRVLGLAKGASERSRQAVEALMAQAVGSAIDRAKFYAALLPIPTDDVDKRTVAAIMRKRERIEEVYLNHPTVTMLDETNWRLYNAVTFVHDHETPRRQVAVGDSNPETSRMEAVIAGNNIGTRAYELLGGPRWTN